MKTVAFECSICGSLHKTESLSNECEVLCQNKADLKTQSEIPKQELIELQNYVRLNAECIDDIPRLVNKVISKINPKIKKVTMDLKVRFNKSIPTTHGRPIGMPYDNSTRKPTMGFSGKVVWKMSASRDYDRDDSLFGSYIKGIHTGTGNGSLSNFADSFEGEFYIFLDDFPKMKAKYQYLTEQLALYDLEFDTLQKDLNGKIIADTDIYDCTSKIKEVDHIIEEVRSELRNRINELETSKKKMIQERTDIINTRYRNAMDTRLDDLSTAIVGLDVDKFLPTYYQIDKLEA